MSDQIGLIPDHQPAIIELQTRPQGTSDNLGTLAFANSAAPSADTAAAAPAAYSQAHIQSLIDELRDLKTKLREQGILST